MNKEICNQCDGRLNIIKMILNFDCSECKKNLYNKYSLSDNNKNYKKLYIQAMKELQMVCKLASSQDKRLKDIANLSIDTDNVYNKVSNFDDMLTAFENKIYHNKEYNFPNKSD